MAKAKPKFYAVKKGFDKEKNEAVINRIYTTWAETQKVVIGVPAEYKSFGSLEEAEAYLDNQVLQNKSEANYDQDALHAYVDGSFNKDIPNYSYGLVCVKDGKVIDFDGAPGNNPEAISMQQIGGELLGAIHACLTAKRIGESKVVIFHDYKGVGLHATGEWKRSNVLSETYYNWMQDFFSRNPDITVTFCKVDAHTGDDFNELADGLAKLALGITPDPIFYRMVEKHGLSLRPNYTSKNETVTIF